MLKATNNGKSLNVARNGYRSSMQAFVMNYRKQRKTDDKEHLVVKIEAKNYPTRVIF
jgi:ribosomal protein L35AE/L33A